MNSELWNQVKSTLCKKNNHLPIIKTLLNAMKPSQSNESDLGILEVEFQVGSNYHKREVEDKLRSQLQKELHKIYDMPIELKVCVNKKPKPQKLAAQLDLKRVLPSKRCPVRNEFTFNSFVVGTNNEFAYKSSLRLAQNPDGNPRSNPLFIFGPTGLGKTHLLNAIGNYIFEEKPSLRITYVSAENFLNEFVSGTRHKQMQKFRNKYRNNTDVLLIDDIHVLGNAEKTQEEFFHTLNSFFETKKQVVVASDKLPKDISGLKDRIRTRLEGGLIADIRMPDLETRIRILKYKASQINICLSNEVIQYISKISKRSIRELEGNLNKVYAYLHINNGSISIDFVKKILSLHESGGTISSDDILQMVSESFKVSVSDMRSKNRQRKIAIARQVAMKLLHKHMNKTLKEIGLCFGGKDHSTVLNAIKKVDTKLNLDQDLRKVFIELECLIQRRTGV